MGAHVNKPRIENLRKAMTMSGYDDVTHVGIIVREGYDEIRIDSVKAYNTAIANQSVMINTLRFAEKNVTGAYGKAIIGDRKTKTNNVSRLGVIAHVPH